MVQQPEDISLISHNPYNTSAQQLLLENTIKVRHPMRLEQSFGRSMRPPFPTKPYAKTRVRLDGLHNDPQTDPAVIPPSLPPLLILNQ